MLVISGPSQAEACGYPGKRLLDQDLKPAHAFESEKETFSDLINLEGIATTALRPSGNGNFNGRILSVVAMGEFIEKGQRIRITNVAALRSRW